MVHAQLTLNRKNLSRLPFLAATAMNSAPVNRHSKSPIDATRALIGRALVLMTLNPFERVAVSIKLVNMLLRSSSPPASLVFDVFFMRTNFQKTFENAI